MTPRQAAEILGCSDRCVRDLIRAGRLEAIRTDQPDGTWMWDISARAVAAERRRYRRAAGGRGRPRGTTRGNHEERER